MPRLSTKIREVGRAIARVACVLVMLATTGCEVATDADLLVVRDVQPEALELGGLLEVTGEGFPAGRAVKVTLWGRFHGVGQAPRDARVVLPGRALSYELAVAEITDRFYEAFDRRGTFHGIVRVSIRAHDGLGEVSGASPEVTLDVLSSGEPLSRRVERSHVARETFAGFGIEPTEETCDGVPCVIAAEVAEPGRAHRAGLRSGDRLLMIDGIRVRTIDDFVSSPDRRESIITVRRDQEAAPLEFTLDHPARASAPLSVLDATLLVLVLVSILVFLPRPLTVRPATRFRGVVAFLLGSAHPTFALRALAFVSALLALSSFSIASAMFRLDALAVSSILIVLVTVVDGPTLWTLHDVVRTVTRLLSALALTLTVVMVTGSSLLPDIIAHQGPFPHTYLAASSPSVLLGVPLVLDLLGRSEGGAESLPSRMISLVLASYFGCLLFGGAQVDGWPLWLGVSVASLKAYLLFHVARRLSASGITTTVPAAIATGAGLAIAFAWNMLSDLTPLGSALGPVMLISIVVTFAGRALLARRTISAAPSPFV